MEDYYLVEAKQEYTGYLISTLTPSMYNGFRDIFEQSKKILNGNSVFKNFQILMSNVPNWNSYMLDKEVADITKETGCDWLDNLITAVFVSHSKILTSVKVGNYRPRNKKIDLKIPDTTSFIHQCYVQSAREFYKNPMLFLDDTNIVKPDEILKNQSLAQSIIKNSILTTIRKLLPFRSILNEYLTLEDGNNTIMIGNSSTTSNIPQLKTIENTNSVPVITMPNMPNMPNMPTSQQNTLHTIKEEVHKNNMDNANTSSESTIEEKEIVTKGRELNLEEFEAELEKSMESFISSSKLVPKKEKSLDSMSVQKMVSNIKEEFNVQQKNVDSSIDYDDLSFLKGKINLDDLESLSTLANMDDNKTIEAKPVQTKLVEAKPVKQIDNISTKSTLVGDKIGLNNIKTNDFMPNNFIFEHRADSIDIERLKDDGTILDTQLLPNSNFLLNSITPTIKEKPVEVPTNTNTTPKSPQIKKISIKYNLGVPLKKNNGVAKKKKLTLLSEAADSDSSEMIFR